MTDRIDHTAEAMKHLDDGEGYTNDAHSLRFEGDEDRAEQALAHAALAAQQAQAEATLAIAEQAQIANLIALSTLAGREDVQEEVADAAYQALSHLVAYKRTGPDDEYPFLNPAIAAALGIENGGSVEHCPNCKEQP